MREAYLGIDCGTQSTKALVLDADTGETLGIGRAGYDIVSRPDGTREQDPRWWIEAMVPAVRSALAVSGDVEVAGISVSGQQHGLVALDAADVPVRGAKLWNDTSTVADSVALAERMGGELKVHAVTGNVFLAAYTAPKIAWLRRCEPEAYGRARRFCLPHDWLNLWLSGTFASEAGDASGTAYFDIRSRRYAPEVLAALDDGRDWQSALPPILPSDAVLGTLRGHAASALGLRAGIPLATGGGDNMCAAIGVGAVVRGVAVISLGTSGTIFGRADEPAVDPLREVSAFCDSTGGWLPLACVLNCTLPIEWARGLFGIDRPSLERIISTAVPGASGLRFVPYLDGERTPNLPNAAGAFSGVRSLHSGQDFVQAVVEGVTSGLAHALEAFRRTGSPAHELLLVGGGARSDAWAQLLADWLGLRISRPIVDEAAARGAAIQAAHAIGGRSWLYPATFDGQWEPRRTREVAELAASYLELGAAPRQAGAAASANATAASAVIRRPSAHSEASDSASSSSRS